MFEWKRIAKDDIRKENSLRKRERHKIEKALFGLFDANLIEMETKWKAGCGSVGRAVASDTIGPRHKSSHWQNSYWTCLGTASCWNDKKKGTKRPGREHLKWTYLLLAVVKAKLKKEKEAVKGPLIQKLKKTDGRSKKNETSKIFKEKDAKNEMQSCTSEWLCRGSTAKLTHSYARQKSNRKDTCMQK